MSEQEMMARIKELEDRLEKIQAVVSEQSEEENLWCIETLTDDEWRPITIGEIVVQQALRRLHEVIEGQTSEECARKALENK